MEAGLTKEWSAFTGIPRAGSAAVHRLGPIATLASELQRFPQLAVGTGYELSVEPVAKEPPYEVSSE